MQKITKNEPSSKTSVFTMQRMVGLAAEFGFVIALPLIAFGLGGKWLDSRYHTDKLFTLIGIALALVASTALLARRISAIRAELTKTGT